MDDQTQPSPEKNSYETVESDLSSTVLDLALVELPPTLTELDLTANRLSSLDPRISHLSILTKLSFRQNLIDDAAFDPISRLVLSVMKKVLLLQELVLKKLLNFDVSFNEITSLHGLSKVSNTLKELYVYKKNEVPKIEEIDYFLDLQFLELVPSSNRLQL
ncbi:hypothetical protein Ddye_022800 [Dipteronia dyeriana]|uniref:Uncharacterized protein n=1 Tax=Dipteronia dyeriana TaxID=168575 RepID=A0AAD9TS82_9ROSI|nr:hypothetical protein Ddye_022800 [Dipteronia dyeriana]